GTAARGDAPGQRTPPGPDLPDPANASPDAATSATGRRRTARHAPAATPPTASWPPDPGSATTVRPPTARPPRTDRPEFASHDPSATRWEAARAGDTSGPSCSPSRPCPPIPATIAPSAT